MKQTNERQTIFEFIQSPQVTAIISAMGLLVLLANLWIVSKLAPLATSIHTLEARADHTDQSLLTFTPKGELEALINPIREDVAEIKTDLRDIKQAINRL